MPGPLPPKISKEEYEEEIKKPFYIRAMKFQVPAGLIYLVERGVEIINFYFIGHYGSEEEMGGVTIGNSVIILVLLGTLIGLSITISSFIAQAYSMDNLDLSRDYLNKGRICAVILVTISTLMFILCKPLLLFIGLDSEVVYYAYIYMLVQIPGLFMLAQFEVLRSLIMATGDMHLGLGISCSNIFLHIFWNYLFVVYLNWGVFGTSMASNFSFAFFYISMSILLTRYEKFNYIQKFYFKSVFNGF